MKPSLAFTTSLLLALTVGGFIVAKLLRPPHDAATPPPSAVAASVPEMPVTASDLNETIVATNTLPDDSVQTDPDERRAAVENRKDELMQLAANNDRQSLKTILSELGNSDPEIRHTAVEAVKSFGDRSAVPRLQQIAEATDDVEERKAILDTIHYLNLPSLSEFASSQQSRSPSVEKVSHSSP